MKNKSVAPLLAAGAFVGAASADSQGLITETKESVTPGLYINNVYACFDGDNDRLLSVGFANIRTQDSSDFFQHPQGLETAPLGFLLPIFPDLVDDTFVTIGVKNTDDAPNGLDGATLDPDYANTGNKISGGWFNNNPASGQGDAANYADGYVLIGQFTVFGDGSSGVVGDLTVFWQGDSTGGAVVGEEASFGIPTPGVMTLLGVAGLAARRRRRA